ILVDDRSEMDRETNDLLQVLGLSHLLSISGLHVGIIATLFFSLLLFLFKRSVRLTTLFPVKKIAAGVTFVPVLLYILMANAPSPAVRTGIMVSCYLASLIFYRELKPWNTLSAAALLLLAWSPVVLFERSFQLSFLAMIGLLTILIAPPFEKKGMLAKTALISLATLLMTAPIASSFSQTFSLAGLLCNFVAIPLFSFILLPLAFCGGFLGLLFPPIGSFFMKMAGLLSDLFFRGMDFILPWMTKLAWPVSLTTTEMILFYLFLGSVILFCFRPENFRKKIVLSSLTLVLFLTTFIFPFVSPLFSDQLKVHFLDVGEGDSILVEFPGGPRWLVDTGGFLIPPKPGEPEPFNTGERVVLPYLLRHRIYHLDKIFITHSHPDHEGGLPPLLKKISVGEVRHSPARTEPLTINGVRVEELYPSQAVDFSNNNDSLVLRLSYGKHSFLLTGDLEADGEKRLLAIGKNLHSTILKVPHHGSNTSSTLPFLEAVRPELAVISCGYKNLFHFPRPEVLERYKELGIPVVR
ncbi:MAG: DNA internalization-related competence protein ComEC/Rec2, partial [bacterium]|nr:DNA internalization-related competence protein ComEC/Rec2 [bacterium]